MNYVDFMEMIAADPKHGYSQVNRWGPDYDCSSLTITALEQDGIPAKSSGATYTGNMFPVLTRLGFSDVKKSVNMATCAGMQRGDILLNEVHHVAVYCGGGMMVHARGQSYGTPKTGDQGQEIAVTAYYNYPWDHVLRLTKAPANTGIVGECSVVLPQLVGGAECPEVKTIQIILNGRGYKGRDGKRLDVDGELGVNTAYAIERLQRDAGMVNINFGTVAKRTWEMLLKGA